MLRPAAHHLILVAALVSSACSESGAPIQLVPAQDTFTSELPEEDAESLSGSIGVFPMALMPVVPALPPIIDVSPQVIDFEQVFGGDVGEVDIDIRNLGLADLHVSGFTLSGSQFFALHVLGKDYPVGQDTQDGITFDDPIGIGPEGEVFFTVRFSPVDDQKADGILVIRSDAPAAPEVTVLIKGNQVGACITTNPQQLKFGGKKIDTVATLPLVIESCGDAPLEITGLHLSDDSHPDYSVDRSALGQIPCLDEPLVIPIGADVTIHVTFAPSEETPVDGRGEPIPPEGILIIENNSFYAAKEVHISGFGALVACPTPVIQVAEGPEVSPQQVLHLYGNQSYADSGAISAWEWSVEQPLGSQSLFIPSATFPNPSTLARSLPGFSGVMLPAKPVV